MNMHYLEFAVLIDTPSRHIYLGLEEGRLQVTRRPSPQLLVMEQDGQAHTPRSLESEFYERESRPADDPRHMGFEARARALKVSSEIYSAADGRAFFPLRHE